MDFAGSIFWNYGISENPGWTKNKAVDYIKSVNITGMRFELAFTGLDVVLT
ncbi:MAG: hypothetical protein PWP63_1212 [Methanolobus sp.]|jgi:hypothetical protein|nr:hypothetical protein [Methanolobus sp.]